MIIVVLAYCFTICAIIFLLFLLDFLSNVLTLKLIISAAFFANWVLNLFSSTQFLYKLKKNYSEYLNYHLWCRWLMLLSKIHRSSLSKLSIHWPTTTLFLAIWSIIVLIEKYGRSFPRCALWICIFFLVLSFPFTNLYINIHKIRINIMNRVDISNWYALYVIYFS